MLHEFVCRANIERFRHLLAFEDDLERRGTLLELLADEEERLVAESDDEFQPYS